jgi:hypothetical protein
MLFQTKGRWVNYEMFERLFKGQNSRVARMHNSRGQIQVHETKKTKSKWP